MRYIYKLAVTISLLMFLFGCTSGTDTTVDEVPSIRIIFDSNGGSSVSDIVNPEDLTEDDLPEPTRSGYEFIGWYTDSDLENLFDPDEQITATITLYAKWEESGEEPLQGLIYDLEDLDAMRDDLDGYYVLMADIYIPSGWVPIGDEDHPFMGLLDGNGFTIEHETYVSITYDIYGLFGYLHGEVYDVTFINRMIITQTEPVTYGGVTAILDGDGYIHDCTMETHMEVNMDAVEGEVIFGNLVGLMLEGYIENIVSETDIEFNVFNEDYTGSVDQSFKIGGVCGMIESGHIEYVETKGIFYYSDEDTAAITSAKLDVMIGGISGYAANAQIVYVLSRYQIGGYFLNYNPDLEYYLSAVVGKGESISFTLIDIVGAVLESDFEGTMDVWIGGVSGKSNNTSLINVANDYTIRNFTYDDMGDGVIVSGGLVGEGNNINATMCFSSANIQYYYVSESDVTVYAGGFFGIATGDTTLSNVATDSAINVYGYPITSLVQIGKVYGYEENLACSNIYKWDQSDLYSNMEFIVDTQPGTNIIDMDELYASAYQMFGS
ncbi:MAG TPA: InlB B-repeat-containing protein, partial [Bacillota bacterium]|nr:InlB B-repeat-containing protein [Bacillota bacterium]